MDPIRSAVEAMMRHDLRSGFRRVCWVGDWPPDVPDTPLILYANHHHYFDGHLHWLVATDRLDRPSTLWMAEFDTFPFFAAVGVQPFPRDDSARRAATLRRTGRRFREDPQTVLVYFPEGELHAPDDGIRPFDAAAVERIGRLYPEATWWPVAVHVTWWGESSPTALLQPGPLHDSADGHEHDRLSTLWHDLRDGVPPEDRTTTLLDGYRGASEVWDLSLTTSFFERYL